MNNGELSRLPFVRTAKIASQTTPDKPLRLLCIYCDNSYDRAQLEQCLRVLVGALQMGRPSSYKADAFTLLGIDSKHRSRIMPALYRATDFVQQSELDELAEQGNRARTRRPSGPEFGLQLAEDSE